MKRIVFTGGGTAGHVMPNIALIESLHHDYDIFYFGSSGMEKNLLNDLILQKKLNYVEINPPKFKRKLSLDLLKIPFLLQNCIKECTNKLKEINPTIVFSKGGYVGFPVVVSAKKLGIHTIIHESDYSFGLANKLLINSVNKVFIAFDNPSMRNKNTNLEIVGIPIRQQIFNGNKLNGLKLMQSAQFKDKMKISNNHFNGKRRIILVVGGSLGAQRLNETIYKVLDNLTEKYDICVITGKGKKINIEKEGFCQFEFISKIEDLYSACDLVICRAGANTIFELLALNKNMILIPLIKQSRGEQIKNAQYMKDKKLAGVINENDITDNILLTEIQNQLESKTIIRKHNIKIDGRKDIERYIRNVIK